MENNNTQTMDRRLIEERFWNLEDKMEVVQESIADHEADIVRLKQRTMRCIERLDRLESKQREVKRRTKDD